jgi:hypothetical protein
MTTDEERIAYLAGDDGALSPDPATRADLDHLRDLLADEAVWAEPSAALEDRILNAIASEVAASPPARARPAAVPVRRRSGRLMYAVAAAAVAAAIIGVVAVRLNANTATPTFAAAMAPSNLAPGASGHATLTRTDAGWRVALHVAGLPRLDNGRFYEAWLKNEAGSLVPIGTFNSGPDVTLWAGVTPQDFPTLTVTEQQANGNNSSSGLRVLAGPITPRH